MTKKITAALLNNPDAIKKYRIQMQLQEGKTADFIFNDREIATAYYDQLRGQLVLAGLAIKQIDLIEL